MQKRLTPTGISKYAQEWQGKEKLEFMSRNSQGYNVINSSNVNEYFVKHSDHIIGKPSIGTRWGELDVDGAGVDVAKKLEELIERLPENIFKPVEVKQKNTLQNTQKKIQDSAIKDFAFMEKDGKIYQQQGKNLKGEGIFEEVDPKNWETIKSYLPLMKSLNNILSAQLSPETTDAKLSELRQTLNKNYSNFVEKHGFINSPKNVQILGSEPNYGRVAAIEKYTQDKKTKEESATKADIFFKRTVNAITKPTKANTADEALKISLAMGGDVNLKYMQELTGKTQDELIKELGDSIYKNPETFNYELAEEYLSGNVREKMAVAKEAAKTNPEFKRNIEVLEKIQPRDLTENEIATFLGASWIPKSYYEEFARTLNNGWEVEVFREKGKFVVIGNDDLVKHLGEWHVDGTNDTLYDYLQFALNRQTMTRSTNGKIDPRKTALSQAKIRELNRLFDEWIFKDEERKKDLIRSFNTNFNNSVARKYDGSHLREYLKNTGLAADVAEKLYPHQLDAIWRIMQGKNTLLAHCVGAGKTWEMVVAGHELKRIGKIQKPLYTVPNNIVKQFENDILAAYPDAKILVLDSKNLPLGEKNKNETEKEFAARKAKRRATLARIVTEDWDYILASHETFKRLQMSPEYQTQFYSELIEELKIQRKQIQASNDDSKTKHSKKSALKKISTKIQNLEMAKNAAVKESEKGESDIPFDELGIDQIFVDESDLFKNLFFETVHDNVAGISKNGSGRAFDMYQKTSWLNKQRNGGGVVFASGTPVSNTLNEIFTILRYLMPKSWLQANHFSNFDEFAGLFVNFADSTELNAGGGGYKLVKRSVLTNLQALRQFVDYFTDYKSAEDMPHLERPEVERISVLTEATETQKGIIAELTERAKDIHDGTVSPNLDNMLKVTGDGRKCSIDARLNDPNISEAEAGGKIPAACNNIFETYNETKDVKGTQVVFLDLGTPAKKKPKNKNADEEIAKPDDEEEETEVEELTAADYSLYDRIKQGLILRGIPEKQIAFVHEAKNADQRQKLFDAVNNGDIRVIIGSTQKMGAGTNFQKHLVALHHLDCPWRPRDIEQREGRILRNGNLNKKVKIFDYLTKGTIDGFNWEKIRNKQKMINAFWHGNTSFKEIEDISGLEIKSAEFVAAVADNPLMQERAKLEQQLINLRIEHSVYVQNQEKNRNTKADIERRIALFKKEIKDMKADIAEKIDVKGDAFKMKIGETVYEKRAAAENALNDFMKNFKNTTSTKIGEIGGFNIKARANVSYISQQGSTESKQDEVYLSLENHGYYYINFEKSLITAITNFINKGIEKSLSDYEGMLDQNKSQLADIEKEIAKPFDLNDELQNAESRLKELDAAIARESYDRGRTSSRGNRITAVINDLNSAMVVSDSANPQVANIRGILPQNVLPKLIAVAQKRFRAKYDDEKRSFTFEKEDYCDEFVEDANAIIANEIENTEEKNTEEKITPEQTKEKLNQFSQITTGVNEVTDATKQYRKNSKVTTAETETESAEESTTENLPVVRQGNSANEAQIEGTLPPNVLSKLIETADVEYSGVYDGKNFSFKNEDDRADFIQDANEIIKAENESTTENVYSEVENKFPRVTFTKDKNGRDIYKIDGQRISKDEAIKTAIEIGNAKGNYIFDSVEKNLGISSNKGGFVARSVNIQFDDTDNKLIAETSRNFSTFEDAVKAARYIKENFDDVNLIYVYGDNFIDFRIYNDGTEYFRNDEIKDRIEKIDAENKSSDNAKQKLQEKVSSVENNENVETEKISGVEVENKDDKPIFKFEGKRVSKENARQIEHDAIHDILEDLKTKCEKETGVSFGTNDYSVAEKNIGFECDLKLEFRTSPYINEYEIFNAIKTFGGGTSFANIADAIKFARYVQKHFNEYSLPSTSFYGASAGNNYRISYNGEESIGKDIQKYLDELENEKSSKPTSNTANNEITTRANKILKDLKLENLRPNKNDSLGRTFGKLENDGTITANFDSEINDAEKFQAVKNIAKEVGGKFNADDNTFNFKDINDTATFFKAVRMAFYGEKDKPVEGNKRTSNVGIELPEGYKTETGKPLNESKIYDFIVDNDGNKNFGEINSDMEKATGGILQAAPIRLQVGNNDFGFMHINLKHAEEIQNKGYSDAISYIQKILQNVDKIYSRADIGRTDRFILFSKGAEGHSSDFMPIDFELEKGNDDYYRIVTTYPKGNKKIEGILIFDDSTHSSPVTATGSLIRLADDKSGVSYHGANAKTNIPTISSESVTQTEDGGNKNLEKDNQQTDAEITEVENNKTIENPVKVSGELTKMKNGYNFKINHFYYYSYSFESKENWTLEDLNKRGITKLAKIEFYSGGSVYYTRWLYKNGTLTRDENFYKAAKAKGGIGGRNGAVGHRYTYDECPDGRYTQHIDKTSILACNECKLFAFDEKTEKAFIVESPAVETEKLPRLEDLSKDEKNRQNIIGKNYNDAELDAQFEENSPAESEKNSDDEKTVETENKVETENTKTTTKDKGTDKESVPKKLSPEQERSLKIKKSIDDIGIDDATKKSLLKNYPEIAGFLNELIEIVNSREAQKVHNGTTVGTAKGVLRSYIRNEPSEGKTTLSKDDVMNKAVYAMFSIWKSQNGITRYDPVPEKLSKTYNKAKKIDDNRKNKKITPDEAYEEMKKVLGKNYDKFESANSKEIQNKTQDKKLSDSAKENKDKKISDSAQEIKKELSKWAKISKENFEKERAIFENASKPNRKKAEEIAKYWFDKYRVKVIFYKPLDELDFDTVKDHLIGVEEVIKEFPVATDVLNSITIGTPENSDSYFWAGIFNLGIDNDRSMPLFDIQFPSVAINKNMKAIPRTKSENKGTGSHEAGHVLHFAATNRLGVILRGRNEDKNENKFNQSENLKLTNNTAYFITQWAYDSIKDKFKDKTFKDLALEISNYASTRYRETVAEAVKDYVLHKEKAAPLSVAIWQKLKAAFETDEFINYVLLSRSLEDAKKGALKYFGKAFSNKAAFAWYSANKNKVKNISELRRATEDILFDRELAEKLKKTKTISEWEKLLQSKIPDEKILKQKGEWTDEKILEAAKNPSIEKVIMQLGGMIKGNKISFNDEVSRQAIIKFLENTVHPVSMYSLNNDGNAEITITKIDEFLSPENLNSKQTAIANFAKEMGVPVIFFKGNKKFHGKYSNGLIYLNVDSETSYDWAFWHESFHWLAKNNPALLNEIADAVGITERQIDDYREEIGREDLTDAETIEEILANNMKDVASRANLLQEIGKKNKSLVQRLISWFKSVMDKFTDFFNTPKNGLTRDQKNKMYDAFGKMVRTIKDENGDAIFRFNNRTKAVELANGDVLPSVKFSMRDSVNNMDLDSSGRFKNPYKARKKLQEKLNPLKGVPIKNKSTGIVAQFGNEGIKKFVSDKAVNKSLKNGYTEKQHYEAAMNIKQLFENAVLNWTRADRDNDPNIKDIKYFSCPTNVLGDDAVASIMVKNTLQNGHHIYTIELQELNKPAELKNQAVNDSSAGSKGSTLITRQDSTTDAEESSAKSIQQSEDGSNEKFSVNLSDNSTLFSARDNFEDDEKIRSNIESGRAAIEKVIKNHGVVKSAMHRDDIGDIDILWGWAGDPADNFKKGYGISHIIARREIKNLNGELVAKLMPDVIMKGEKKRGISNKKTEIHYGDYTAILSNDFKGKTVPNWLLTGFIKNETEPSSERGEGFDSAAPTARTPTPARRTRDDNSVSSESIAQNKDDDNTKYSINLSDNSAFNFAKKIANKFFGERSERTRKQMKIALEELSGYKISSGHLASGDISVKDNAKVIRTKSAYDWENILPEVGKIVAEKLNLPATDEMKNYIASWIVDGAPNNISPESKKFQRAMLNADDEFREKLFDAQSKFIAWENKSAMEQLQAIVVSERDEKSFGEKFKDARAKGYSQFFEDIAPVKNMVDEIEKEYGKKIPPALNPYTAFRNFKGMAGRARMMLEGNKLTSKVLQETYPNVDFSGFKTLQTILDEVGALNDDKIYDEFKSYVIACHLKEIHERNKKNLDAQEQRQQKIDTLQENLKSAKNKKATAELEKKIKFHQKKLEDLKKAFYVTPFSEKKCDEIISDYGKKYSASQRDLVRFSNTLLAIMYDSGVVGKNTYEGLLEKWKNYVPLHRLFDENENLAFGDSLKTMEGSARDIIDPIQAIIASTNTFIKRAEKNKAKILLANLTRCNGVGKLIEEVDGKTPDDHTVITFYEDGVKKYLQTDEAVVYAVNNMTVPQINWFQKFLRIGTTVVRNCMTLYNPNFAIRNLTRDMQDAYLYSGKHDKKAMDAVKDIIQTPILTLKYTWKGLTGKLKDDKDFQEWMIHGGAQASFWSMDRDYTQTTIDKLTRQNKKELTPYQRIKQPAAQFLNLLAAFGEYSEIGTRIGHYKKVKEILAKKHGGKNIRDDLVTAAFESRDLMDFARGGAASRNWNVYTAFANAHLQGIDKFRRTFALSKLQTAEGRKEFGYSLLRLMMSSVLPAILFFILNHDEDWYKKDLNDYERRSHWILGENVRVPKGMDFGIRFMSNFTEDFLNWASNNKPVKFQETFVKPLQDEIPDMLPTLLQPIIESMANYDMFSNNPVVPRRLQGLPEKLQYDDRTPDLAKYLGEVTDYSPKKIEHIMFGFTGNIGKGTMRVADTVLGDKQAAVPPADWLPLIGGFFRIPYRNPKIINDYYEQLDKQTKLYNEFKLTGEMPEGYDDRLFKRIKKAQKDMKKFSQLERAAVENPNISNAEKDRRQIAIQKKRIALVEQVMR